MSFTIDDFEDLPRLLYERPEWQDRLRRAILPPELFELPRIAQELADANRADRERVARLETEQQATRKEVREGFAQTGKRLDGVETRLGGVEAGIAAVRSEATVRFNRVDARLLRMGTDIGSLKGVDMEERMRARVPQFRHLVPRPVALTPVEVGDLMDSEVAAGRLLPGEARRIERADLIVRSSESSGSPYLVLEVSWLVEERDVRRAHDRAALLRKAGYNVLGAVAGTHIQPEALALAERLGVERAIDDELDDDGESVPDEMR